MAAEKPKRVRNSKRRASEKTEEDKNIEYLESRYMFEKRHRLYIANEDVNMVWDATDREDFIKAWNERWPIKEMESYFGADRWEIYLLAIDLLKKGDISGRVGLFREVQDDV